VRQGSIVNAASHLPGSLPGGALAPGSLAIVEGLRFDPGDVRVEIEARGKVYPATVVDAASERLTVRLPRLSPAGPAKLFVSSRGKRSVGSDIRLAPGAFGIFTVNRKGWGPAAPTVWAPGARATVTGTGLGGIPENAIKVFVAGRAARHVRRRERNDAVQLSFDIPADSPEGCAVPVVVVAGGLTSNTAALRVGRAGDCAHGPSRASSGSVVLLRSDVILELEPGKPVPFRLDNFAAGFDRPRAVRESGPLDLLPPAGSCTAWAGPFNSSDFVLPTLLGPAPGDADTTIDLGPAVAERTESLEDLDAGPELTLTGPLGVRRIRRSGHQPRIYSAMLGGNPPLARIAATPLFLVPGMYRVDVPGGADVGGASAPLEISDPIVWRNREATGVLDRRTGVEMEWTLQAGYTGVGFAWNIDRRSGAAGVAVCVAARGADRIRMPGTALANLPATGSSASDLSLGFLGVAGIPIEPLPLRATGLDESRVAAVSLSGRSVVVK
jgi:uncharacterized protein (TIGR03437 family)